MASCTIAGYMSNLTCKDVEAALRSSSSSGNREQNHRPRKKRRLNEGDGIEAEDIVDYQSEEEQEEEEDGLHSLISQLNKGKQNAGHEHQHQADFGEWHPADKEEEYTEEELLNRLPRAVLP